MNKHLKKKIVAGSSKKATNSNNFWNNSLSFGIIGSTILALVQFIFTAIVSLTTKDDDTNKTSNFNPNYNKSKVTYRLSKYPSKSTVFI